MFKALMTVRLASLRAWAGGLGRGRQAPSGIKKVGFVLLLLYVLGVFAFLFYQMFQVLAPLLASDSAWLYFAVFTLMAFAMIFIASVFSTKAQLFEAKDNELLLSMPIPPAAILASRMVLLLIINVGYELLVAVPAAIVWIGSGAASAMGAAAFFLICVLLPFFTLAVSALFAWLISLVTRRVRNTAAMTTVFSLVFLGAYFYFFSNLNSILLSLTENITGLAHTLGAVTPLYWIGCAVTTGSLPCLLLSVLVLLVPFVLAWALLSATFLRTATMQHSAARIEYRDRGQKVSSLTGALYTRELRRFTASASYMLNEGLGALFLVVGAVALLIKRSVILALVASEPLLAEMMVPLALLGVCMMSSMSAVTAPSISMEGQNLWILQSLPVRPWDALLAKIHVHLSLVIPPVLLCEAALLFVFRPTGLLLLDTLVLPIVFTVFMALLGLMVNLRHPKLDWVNETQAVKNSFSVFLAMMGGWVAVLLPAAIGALAPRILPLAVSLLLYTLLLAVVCTLLYHWLRRRGCAIYAAL